MQTEPVKPHISYVLPPFERYSPESGGALSTITLNHARELRARGHRVSLLAPDFGGEKYQIEDGEFFTIKHREDLNIVQRFFSSKIRARSHKYEWPYFEYYLSQVRINLQKLKPDVVILFIDFSSSLSIKEVLPFAQVVVYLQNEHNRLRQSEDYLHRNLEATDQIWGCSDYIRDVTRKSYPDVASKVRTLYNGVDTDTFQPRENYLQTPLSNNPVRVLYVGRTDATKGTDLVPRAVKQLQTEGENIELTVAGSTWFYDHEKQNERPYIRELRAAMDEAKASYLGHVARPDLPAVFRAADIVCVPSRFNEPFGLTALEGMASGCAMVVARRGGLPEFCQGAAQLFEPENPDELTDALRRFAQDRELLWRHKKWGRARALEYSWSATVERMEKLLSHS